MKTLEDYKINSGLSYAKMEKQLHEKHGGRRCRTTLHKAVNTPWRTKWPTFKLIADLLGMPEAEAEKQWKDSKLKFNEAKYKS